MEPSSRVCSKESGVKSEASSGRAVKSLPGSWEVERRWYCSNTPLDLASPCGELSTCWRDSRDEPVVSFSSPPLFESPPSTPESRFRKSWDRMLEVATRNSTGPLWALSEVIPLPVGEDGRVQWKCVNESSGSVICAVLLWLTCYFGNAL